MKDHVILKNNSSAPIVSLKAVLKQDVETILRNWLSASFATPEVYSSNRKIGRLLGIFTADTRRPRRGSGKGLSAQSYG